jgi:peptide/nickel transport system permease protein
MSWGKLVQNGESFFMHGWWLSVMPGLAIVVTCAGLTLLMEGFRDD